MGVPGRAMGGVSSVGSASPLAGAGSRLSRSSGLSVGARSGSPFAGNSQNGGTGASSAARRPDAGDRTKTKPQVERDIDGDTDLESEFETDAESETETETEGGSDSELE